MWRISPSGRSTRISPNHSSPASAAALIDSKIASRSSGCAMRRSSVSSSSSAAATRDLEPTVVDVDDPPGRRPSRRRRAGTTPRASGTGPRPASRGRRRRPGRSRPPSRRRTPAARRVAPATGSTRARTWRTVPSGRTIRYCDREVLRVRRSRSRRACVDLAADRADGPRAASRGRGPAPRESPVISRNRRLTQTIPSASVLRNTPSGVGEREHVEIGDRLELVERRAPSARGSVAAHDRLRRGQASWRFPSCRSRSAD